MRIYWATFFVGDVVMIRKVEAPNDAKALDLAERHAQAASRATGDVYHAIGVHEEYPSEYVITEAKVSDLEFLSRHMRKEK